jgi:excisionase family DNA binding protein
MAKTTEQLMTTVELAEYLEIPIATLYGWRTKREGPPAIKVGRHLRYRASDVERWLETRSG